MPRPQIAFHRLERTGKEGEMGGAEVAHESQSQCAILIAREGNAGRRGEPTLHGSSMKPQSPGFSATWQLNFDTEIEGGKWACHARVRPSRTRGSQGGGTRPHTPGQYEAHAGDAGSLLVADQPRIEGDLKRGQRVVHNRGKILHTRFPDSCHVENYLGISITSSL